MESALVQSHRSAHRAPTTPVNQPAVRVIEDQRTEPHVSLFEDNHVPPVMLHDVIHRGPMTGQGSKPLLGLDGVFLCFESKEFLNRNQSIVAELQSVPGDLPGIDM
jgi:hypothetical protein